MKVPLWLKKIVAKDERLANFLKRRYENLARLTTKNGAITSLMEKRLVNACDLMAVVGMANLERIEISPHAIIAVMKNGMKFFVRPGQSTTSALFYTGSFEEEETNLMRGIIKKIGPCWTQEPTLAGIRPTSRAMSERAERCLPLSRSTLRSRNSRKI